MKKVFVNGYGSIGSRIVSFLKDDPEIKVIGVGKYSPDAKVEEAISKGLNVYVPEKKMWGGWNLRVTWNICSFYVLCKCICHSFSCY